MSARTCVLVEHDGQWHPGTLRSTATAPDGTTTCLVTWRLPDGEIRIDRIPARRVKAAG